MEKYFDAHVYVANWGTRVFMLRLPERLLDRETTASYCACDWLDVRFKDGFAILEFRWCRATAAVPQVERAIAGGRTSRR